MNDFIAFTKIAPPVKTAVLYLKALIPLLATLKVTIESVLDLSSK